MRKLQSFKVPNGKEKNSLNYWWKFKNPLNVAVNFLVIELTKILPSLRLKRILLKCLGMKVGKNAAVGLGVQFDIFFPELIELGENCMLGYGTTILCHEFLLEELRIGKVKMGRNVMIGTNTTILPGVEVGENSTVSACSLVNKEVKAGSFVGGVPIKELRRKK